MNLNRRELIQKSLKFSTLTAFGFFGFRTSSQDAFALSNVVTGNNSLREDSNGILALHEGFTYSILQKAGGLMDDGFKIPGKPDGMGVFPLDSSRCVIVRNHELHHSFHWALAPYQKGKHPPEVYDPEAPGCVSRIVYNFKQKRIESSNLILAGTLFNCAGGVSPWGWLTCEENVDHLTKPHGFVFACDPQAAVLRPPQPIHAYGRFMHEAAAVDPVTLIVYLTEDRMDGGFYRFVPENISEPFKGQLQALKLKEPSVIDFQVGEARPIEWTTISSTLPDDDSVRVQAQKQNAMIFKRGEGLVFQNQRAYFCCTAGGKKGIGQIYELNTVSMELTLLAEAEDPEKLNVPDNVAISSWGDLYLAEDNEGVCHIRIFSKGKIHTLARNQFGVGEFSGLCLSPDQKTLFANLQFQNMTLAIHGPFEELTQASR